MNREVMDACPMFSSIQCHLHRAANPTPKDVNPCTFANELLRPRISAVRMESDDRNRHELEVSKAHIP